MKYNKVTYLLCIQIQSLDSHNTIFELCSIFLNLLIVRMHNCNVKRFQLVTENKIKRFKHFEVNK